MIHISRDRERWDSISYQRYGNALTYEPIITANIRDFCNGSTGLMIVSDFMDAGHKLSVPEMPALTTTGLPPWKR